MSSPHTEIRIFFVQDAVELTNGDLYLVGGSSFPPLCPVIRVSRFQERYTVTFVRDGVTVEEERPPFAKLFLIPPERLQEFEELGKRVQE